MPKSRLQKKLKKPVKSLDVPSVLDPTDTVGKIQRKKMINDAYARTPTPKPKTKLKEKLISPDSTTTGSLPADWLAKETKYPDPPKKKRKIPVKRR